MASALEGIRVIDLAQQLAGPGSSMYLADQGAEVVKVEPLAGDTSRSRRNDPVLGTNSPSFMALNRNKRGISLDLRKPAGKAIFQRLVERSDVLITNMRARAAARLGLDFDTLHALYPRLIYGHISGFGTRGPYADKGGYDRLTQGLAGVMYR